MVASTFSGPGSICAPANSDATHQIATNRTSEASRSMNGSLRRARTIEGAGRELLALPHQRRAAEPGEHAIEHARVGLLGFDRPVRNALPVAVAVDLKRGGVARPGERRDALPFDIGSEQDVLGLGGHIEEARHRVAMRLSLIHI